MTAGFLAGSDFFVKLLTYGQVNSNRKLVVRPCRALMVLPPKPLLSLPPAKTPLAVSK